LDTFRDATEDALPAEKIRFATIFLDRGVRDAESLSQDPSIQADVYEGFGEMYQYWGNLERAEQIARRAVEMVRNSLPNDRARIAKAQLALGNVLDERGKYYEAIYVANEVLKVADSRANEPGAYTLLANAYIHLGNLPPADITISER
jgi:tetratricopeptide (TPR) repeat protein